jgi:adenine specific DNA methylase Mod
MDEFKIKEYNQRFWQVAEVFKNGKKIADINKFYDVTTDWIIIYDTVGGSGTGYSKGDILNKIFIGNAEFSKEHCT